MTIFRFAWSFGLFAIAVFSLDASTLRADEPVTLDSNSQDMTLRLPSLVADQSAADDATAEYESDEYESDEYEANSADDTATADTDADDTADVDELIADMGPEPIREHYPNGATKVDRQVIQDEVGNYINHGPWKSYDQRGNVTCEGTYVDGERHGVWNRWYRAGEAELFKQVPYRDFSGPYISQATFENGKLQGKWTVYDAKQHKISEIAFVGGIRHGKAMWWHANGAVFREIDFRDGQIDGSFVERKADGTLTVNDTYQMGRKLAPKIEYHTRSLKKSEGLYLFAALVVDEPDSWWDAKLATYKAQGKDERHGMQTTWYPSGVMQSQGEYRNDIQVGTFTWWYANSQKSIEGSFDDGKQSGLWVWWHENGQKSILGKYAAGEPSGRWHWWQADGKLAQTLDMSQGTSVVVKPGVPAKPAPVASKPDAPNSRSKAATSRSNRPTRR